MRELSGETVISYVYSYDAAGRLVKEESQTEGITYTYEYDSLDRVTLRHQTGADGIKDERYSYDAAGNITQRSSDTGTVTMEYSTGNCITSYNGTDTVIDADGNLVQAYTESGKKEHVYDSRNICKKSR